MAAEALQSQLDSALEQTPIPVAALHSSIAAGTLFFPFSFLPLRFDFDAMVCVSNASNPSPPSPLPNPLPSDASDDESIRVKEHAITALTSALAAARDVPALSGLITRLRQFFTLIPKARTAKIVRSVTDALGEVPGSVDAQVALCNETIEWCRAEKRSFLRMRMQLKLSQL